MLPKPHALTRRTLSLVLTSVFALLLLSNVAQASRLPASWYKRADLTSWWYNEWDNPATNASLSALRATNSTDALFVATWYQPSLTSSTVAPDANKTPDDSGLLRAMTYAKSLGMNVELKLHVDVYD